MGHKKKLLLILLSLVAFVNAKAEKPANRFVWKSGIPVYASPSLQGKAIDTLAYGWVIEDWEQLSVRKETVRIYEYEDEDDNLEVSRSYTHQSNWILIHYHDKEGYVLDTYLMPIPPPFPHEAYVSTVEYLGQNSDIISEEHQGQTEEFCSHDRYTFSTGAYHVFTDLGPCESCGRSIAETYLPGLDVHQGFLFVTILDHITIDNSGSPYDPYQSGIVYFYPRTDHRLEFSTDYTHYTITTHKDGIVIRYDTSL